MARGKLLVGASATMAVFTIAAAAAPAQDARPFMRTAETKAAIAPARDARPIMRTAETKAAPAPARDARPITRTAATKAALASTPSLSEAESNEMIVADFLRRKERAERAQRTILAELRKDLDRRRAEFEATRARFDDARGRYSEIVGPLPTQGVFNPADPRLPYEFEVRRNGLGNSDARSGQLSQQPATGGAVR